jgi:hypothetical protein
VIDYTVQPERAQQPIEGKLFHQYTFDDGTVWTEFYHTKTGYLLRFPELADFEVSAAGDAVVAYPATGTDDVTVEHLYVNQLVPLALSRQGRPAFHASVVTVPGGAIAFLGKTGMGKSTLAASFAQAESSFLTDDALLIDEQNGIRAMPSHASVRLWEDSVEALIPKDVPAAAEVSYTSKSRLLANDTLRYADAPAPLLAAYVLDWQDVGQVVIEPLSGSERQMAWIGNSFLLDIDDRDLLARHFEWTHRISGQVPTFSLDYPRDYGMLPQVRDAVRQHVTGLVN